MHFEFSAAYSPEPPTQLGFDTAARPSPASLPLSPLIVPASCTPKSSEREAIGADGGVLTKTPTSIAVTSSPSLAPYA